MIKSGMSSHVMWLRNERSGEKCFSIRHKWDSEWIAWEFGRSHTRPCSKRNTGLCNLFRHNLSLARPNDSKSKCSRWNIPRSPINNFVQIQKQLGRSVPDGTDTKFRMEWHSSGISQPIGSSDKKFRPTFALCSEWNTRWIVFPVGTLCGKPGD